MNKRYRVIMVILSLVFVINFISGCGMKIKDDDMCFVFDGITLKLNNKEVIVDNLDGYYENFAFSNKGNIIYYDGYNEESAGDFYLYNLEKRTINQLNVWNYFDENMLQEICAELDYLSPEHVFLNEDEGILYFSADIPEQMDYRIFRVGLDTGKIDYSSELYGSSGNFAVNQDGIMLYSREENDCVNIYAYDFESGVEELCINNVQDIISSQNGKYLFYEAEKAYVVLDTDTSKEYVLDKEDFYIEQVSFAFSGDSLISVEYHYNPWSLFSATTIDVRQIDFKTGKSKVILEIKESGNMGILYYDN